MRRRLIGILSSRLITWPPAPAVDDMLFVAEVNDADLLVSLASSQIRIHGNIQFSDVERRTNLTDSVGARPDSGRVCSSLGHLMLHGQREGLVLH